MKTFAARVTDAVVPVAVTARTCEAVIGLPWRVACRLAVKHRVPIIGAGRARMIRIEPFLAALESSGQVTPPTPIEDLTDNEQRAAMAAALGVVRR